MKRSPILLALLLAGCTPPPDTTASNTPPPKPETKPEVSAPKTDEKKPDEKKSEETKPEDQAKGNKNRIYQLTDYKTAQITIGSKKLTVWLADTSAKRQEGMMFLTDSEVKPDEGMLFVFQLSKERGFWMENTLIPLDIAYMKPDGTIISTPTMKALDKTNVPSHGAAQFALEMKAGAFKRLGIKPGMKAVIPKDVKSDDDDG